MSEKNGFLRFLNFISKLIDDRIVYQDLKSDENKRKTTKRFGISAIGYSVGYAVLSVLGALITAKGASGDLGIIVGFFAIIIGAAFLLVSLELLIFAISHTVKQLILNRKAISWIAFSVFIICFLLSAFFILKFIGTL